MGDRCYMALYIHGHIGSLRTLVEVCQAIANEGLVDEVDGRHEVSWHAVFAHFAGNMDEPQVKFVNRECNYADISDAEKVLQKRGVAYSFDHGAGGDYAAGCGAYAPEKGRKLFETDGNYPVLTTYEIRRHIENGTLEDELTDADFATGRGMPEFSVSDKVRVTLAKVIAKRALHQRAA